MSDGVAFGAEAILWQAYPVGPVSQKRGVNLAASMPLLTVAVASGELTLVEVEHWVRAGAGFSTDEAAVSTRKQHGLWRKAFGMRRELAEISREATGVPLRGQVR